MMFESIKLAAQRFASKGFHVFPRYGKVNPHNWVGKDLDDEGKPLSGWIDDKYYCPSTTDINVIATWPESVYKNKLSGYGINPKGRAIVIDVDNYDKKARTVVGTGNKSLNRLIEIYDIDISRAVKVQSKSPGCYHLYFTYPKELAGGEWVRSTTSPEINGIKFDCVDIRADKAFVAGPTPEGPYTIAASAFQELDNLPSLPYSFIANFVVKPNNTDQKVIDDDAEPIPAGGRDDYMFRLMCKLKGLGLSFQKAKAIVETDYKRLEQPKGDEIPVERFVQRLREIYDDSEYNANPFQVTMSKYLTDFAHVKSPFGVFSFETMDFTKQDAATAIYSHIISIDSTDAMGNTKTAEVDVFKKWLKNNDRIRVDGIGFDPSRGAVYEDIVSTGKARKLANTYVKPNHRLVDYKASRCIDAWQYLADYIWEDDVDHAMKWCASIVQQPYNKVQHMLMLISELHGLGKDTFFHGFSRILGEHNTKIIQLENLEEKYNSYLQDNLLILINESNKLSDNKVESVRSKLKFYVTGDRVPIRRMGTDIDMCKTFSNFLLYGNSTKIMSIEDEDNRIYPHINTKKVPLPESFTKEFYAMTDTTEFTENVYSYMMDLSLDGFKHYARAPESQDRNQLIFDNKSSAERRVLEWMDEEFGIFKYDLITRDSFEFMLNEMFNFSFARQDKAAFLDNMWRSLTKKCKNIKVIRMQKIMKRTNVNDIIRVSKSTAPCRVYAVRNFDVYDAKIDNQIAMRQIFLGMAEIDSLVTSAQNLKSEVKGLLSTEK